ncbi:MAG: sulfite exporter TauE/SafE family protein [Eubacterium sp.]|nr:sulfite exporter TauE/SafE family protein [Eubacterium sp.]
MGYEYLIVSLAAALAGIGTGLAGLSAATAMVPLLIVLCPTFGGEHGAFTATAIALASDILGSAVTAGVYAKNKRLDLKHGWILLTCVVAMCTVGSIAAYFTHQTVLGGFSLFLCVAIGIRFLVKPGSKEQPMKSGSIKLSAKEIAVSLFFGLTIGFGTGFFGTGGGMMMLVVFTAMLGYDRRTAVGTSTFIMTFTALIASVSHIMIEPAIIFDCWDYLLISIAVATLFSLISAQFANKVNGKAVGYATGIILLALGLSMIVIGNIDSIKAGVTA